MANLLAPVAKAKFDDTQVFSFNVIMRPPRRRTLAQMRMVRKNPGQGQPAT